MRDKKEILVALKWVCENAHSEAFMRRIIVSQFGKSFYVKEDYQLPAPAAINISKHEVSYNPSLMFNMLASSYDNWKDMYPEVDDGVFVNQIHELCCRFLMEHEGDHQRHTLSFVEAWNLFLEKCGNTKIPMEFVALCWNIVEDGKVDTKQFSCSKSFLEKEVIRDGIKLFRTINDIQELIDVLENNNYSIRGHLLFLLGYRFVLMGLNKKALNKEALIKRAQSDSRFVLTQEVFDLFDSIMTEADMTIRAERTVAELVPMLYELFLDKSKQEIKDAQQGNGSMLDAQKILESDGSSSSSGGDNKQQDGSQDGQQSNQQSNQSNQDGSNQDGSKQDSNKQDDGSQSGSDGEQQGDNQGDNQGQSQDGSSQGTNQTDDASQDGSTKQENDSSSSSSEAKSSDGGSDSSSNNSSGNGASSEGEDKKSQTQLTDEQITDLANKLIEQLSKEVNEANGNTKELRESIATSDEKKSLKNTLSKTAVSASMAGVDSGSYRINNYTCYNLDMALFREYQRALKSAYNKKPSTKSGYSSGEFDENLIDRAVFEGDLNVFMRITVYKLAKNILMHFLLDVSWSMNRVLSIIRAFLPELIHACESIQIKTRLLSYSGSSYLIKDFSDKLIFKNGKSNLKTIFSKVSGLGSTDPTAALNYLLCDSYDYNAMHNNLNILVYITDGAVDTDTKETCEVRFQQLIKLGYKIFPIGIGLTSSGVDRLEELTSSKAYNYTSDIKQIGTDIKKFILKNMLK